MEIDKDSQKIKAALSRGVVEVLPSREGLAQLMRKRRLRLYLGIDPTSPQIHLGHALPLRKLREFQELGHETILLIGTFTAQVGDPSGRDKARKPLPLTQIKKNLATYKKQAAKILDLNKTRIDYNHKWLGRLKFGELVELASHFTVSRLLERDMFQRRLKKGDEVWASELLYPLMQGYDSVALNVDLEVGSTDQTFNMLVGRKLQKLYNKKEKFVLTTPMLVGLDGRKMSKSYGNAVNLTDSPKEMFGKIMSLKDELIGPYFELCTGLLSREVEAIRRDLEQRKVNPREVKARLAREIVKAYHGPQKAQKAEQEFDKIFREKRPPSKIRKVALKEKALDPLSLLIKTKLVSSKTQGKRLVLQGGVRLGGKILTDWRREVELKKGQVLQVGKRRFVRIS